MRPPMHLAVGIISAFLLVGLGGHEGIAQSETRPIYPVVGEALDANFKWSEDPESAVVWVFREPVSQGDRGGRIITRPSEGSQWPDRSALIEKTSLTLRPHPVYSGNALRTTGEYPARQNGTEQRYLLVIETSRGIYCSRTLEDARGNRPRYHMLSSPAHVRVGRASPEWEKQARALISRVQQAKEKRSDPADATATASSESVPSEESSTASAGEASANSAESSAFWSNFSFPGRKTLGIGLLAVVVVPFLLLYYFTRSGKERTDDSPNSDDEFLPQDLKEANDSLKVAFKAWCDSDRPLMSMGSRFEWFVREKHGGEVPLSHWQAHSHDRYVRAAPSNATHWAFRSEDAAILLPRPEGTEFASLRGFEGRGVPGEFDDIDPAYVFIDGDEAELRVVGEIR